jgi:hypothetical protein
MKSIVTGGDAATMTSIELVDFINSHRQQQAEASGQNFPSKGYAKLEHADFMKKVNEVLGPNAGNFSGIYRDSRNREQLCYRFPKRESCLMSMDYLNEKTSLRFTPLVETSNRGAGRGV